MKGLGFIVFFKRRFLLVLQVFVYFFKIETVHFEIKL